MGVRLKRGWVGAALCMLVVAGCNKDAASNVPTITTQPTSQTVTVPAAATFSVVATGQGTLTYQWYNNSVPVAGATSASYTTPPTILADNGAALFVYISNEFGSVESDVIGLTVNGMTSSSARVATISNDPARTGVNPEESILAPGNVNTNSFGKIGSFATDAAVSTQPLYLSNVDVPNVGTRNILYATTANNGVYAFDANSGSVLWRANLNGANETAGDALGCNGSAASIGISSTPVIDASRGAHGTIYVVAMSKTLASAYVQRLHALDAATGSEISGSPSDITATGINALAASANVSANVTSAANHVSAGFDASRFVARGGLLMAGKQIYAAMEPVCSGSANREWIMSFDASSLGATSASNLATPASSSQSSFLAGALAADSTGSVFSSSARTANIAGGPVVLLPDFGNATGNVLHLAMTADSQGDIFLVNRDSVSASASSNIYQQIGGALAGNGLYPSAAFFNGNAYFGAQGDRLKSFAIRSGRLAGIPSTESAAGIESAPAGISLSANGTQNGIVWLTESGNANSPASLRAFDAANLSRELYDSTRAAQNRDSLGANIAIAPPTIANGRVFIATPSGIAVFGARQ